MNRKQPRDIIFGVLNEVYAPQHTDIDWWAARYKDSYLLSVNQSITTDILSHMVFVMVQDPSTSEGDYWHRTLAQEVQNIIWMVHSGGTTAEYATGRIFKELGIEINEA